jgi:hypothetical protein
MIKMMITTRFFWRHLCLYVVAAFGSRVISDRMTRSHPITNQGGSLANTKKKASLFPDMPFYNNNGLTLKQDRLRRSLQGVLLFAFAWVSVDPEATDEGGLLQGYFFADSSISYASPLDPSPLPTVFRYPYQFTIFPLYHLVR